MKEYVPYFFLAAALFVTLVALVYVFNEGNCLPPADVVREVGYARCVYPGYAELVARNSVSDALLRIAKHYPYISVFGYSDENAVLIVYDGNYAYTFLSSGGKTINYWRAGEGYFVDTNTVLGMVSAVSNAFRVASVHCAATDMRPYVVPYLFPEGNVFIYCAFELVPPVSSSSPLEEKKDPCGAMWDGLEKMGKLKRAWLDGAEYRAYTDGNYVFVGSCGEGTYEVRTATAVSGEQTLKILAGSNNAVGP